MRKSTKVEATTSAVGLDLGDRFSQVCWLGVDGSVLEQRRIRTTQEGIGQAFQGQGPWQVALETGTHSSWVARLLEQLGHQVVVSQARQVQLISQSRKKTDERDAENLARLVRADPKLLSPIQPRSVTAQEKLSLIRSRDALVRARTDLINHVRGQVKSWGQRLPSCSTESFAGKVMALLPLPLRAALEPVVEVIAQLSDQLHSYDKVVQACVASCPPAQRWLQISGVGPLTSLTYYWTIEDPSRFGSSRTVGAYLGLTPASRSSGQSQPQLRISKEGDPLLRKLLVQASHHLLGPFGRDSDLRRWGLSLAERGGKNAKKRAVIAVARKLAVLLHRLWVTQQDYQPLREPQVA